MADKETTFKLRFENPDMEAVFHAMSDRVEELDSDLRKLEKTQKETFAASAKATQAANDQLRHQAETLDTNKVKFKGLKDSAQDALEGISEKGGGAISTLSRLGRAGGLAGTILAAAGTAIAAAFLDVEKNASAARREFEGIKAVGQELKTRVFAGIRGLVKYLSGDIAAATQEYATFLGIGRQTTDEVREQGRLLDDLRAKIEQSNRVLIKQEAERAVQLDRLRTLAADESRSTADRIGLIRSAASIEADLNESRIAQLNDHAQLIRDENSLYGEREGSLDQLAGIEAELIELRGTNQVIAIQTQQEVSALLREEAEARDRIIQQIKDANALITSQQVERSIENQIQAFRELRDSVTAAGLADEYAQELENLDTVIAGLEKRLSDGLLKPFEELPTLVGDTLKKQLTSETADPLTEQMEQAGIEAAERLAKSFKERYEELTEDQKRFLEDTFQDIFSSVSDIVVQSTLTQITQQEQVIDARQNDISELERQLAEQERLQAQGVANQSNRLRQSLQEERNILKREQERRLQLEKKAATQRLITNSIQQGSEITLAAAKLLKEGSSGFIPGLIAAAGGIALLFRIIAQAKANAAAFSTPPQFREGTPWLEGPSHERGGVLAELEGGERVLSRSLNEAVGGRQLTNDELINYALYGMTAQDAIGPMSAALASGAASRQQIENAEHDELIAAIRETGAEMIAELGEEIAATRKALKERPTWYATDQAGRREYYIGDTKYVERIVPPKKDE